MAHISPNIAAALGWLNSALARWNEEAFRELSQSLTIEEHEPATIEPTAAEALIGIQEDQIADSVAERAPAPKVESSGPWYANDKIKVSLEKSVVSRLLTPHQKYPGFFYLDERAEKLGAIGFIRAGKAKILLELRYPSDYPLSPPRVFAGGGGLRELGNPDGSLPVPSGPNQVWDKNCNAGHVILWAVAFLEKSFRLTPRNAATPSVENDGGQR